MSLGKKLWTAFGLIASLSIGLAIYGTVALSKMGDVIVRLYDEQLMGVNYARAAATSFSDARRLMDQSLALGSGRPQDASKSLRQASIDIAEDLWIVRQRAHDVEVISKLGKAEKSISDWFTSEAMILDLHPGDHGVAHAGCDLTAKRCVDRLVGRSRGAGRRQRLRLSLARAAGDKGVDCRSDKPIRWDHPNSWGCSDCSLPI